MESISTCIYKWKIWAILSPLNHQWKLILHNFKVDRFYLFCVADENLCITYIHIKLHCIHELVSTHLRYSVPTLAMENLHWFCLWFQMCAKSQWQRKDNTSYLTLHSCFNQLLLPADILGCSTQGMLKAKQLPKPFHTNFILELKKSCQVLGRKKTIVCYRRDRGQSDISGSVVQQHGFVLLWKVNRCVSKEPFRTTKGLFWCLHYLIFH